MEILFCHFDDHMDMVRLSVLYPLLIRKEWGVVRGLPRIHGVPHPSDLIMSDASHVAHPSGLAIQHKSFRVRRQFGEDLGLGQAGTSISAPFLYIKSHRRDYRRLPDMPDHVPSDCFRAVWPILLEAVGQYVRPYAFRHA
jgi:hypothetical protein